MEIIVSELSGITYADKQILSDAGIKSYVDNFMLEYSDIESILPNSMILKWRQIHTIVRYLTKGNTL